MDAGKEGGLMRIGFAGAGKVGFTLGKYMTEHNVYVSGYYSKSVQSAKEASVFTKTRYFRTLHELAAASDAIFLTVPDRAIEEVWNELKQYSIQGKCICHCSGAMDCAVFSGIGQTGASGCSIHPLYAVNSRLQSYQGISEAYFTIEGAKEYVAFWKEFFERLGNPVKVIGTEKKVLYHSAAVFASNFVAGLFETAVSLLLECGFDREGAQCALRGLFLNNCRHVADEGAQTALTGPIERADTKTVEKHLDALWGNEREIYIRLSKALVMIAEQKHPDRNYSELEQLLLEAERSGKKI